MVTKKDAQQAVDDIRTLIDELDELGNAFLLTGNTNVHFKLARHVFRVRDCCICLELYVLNR